MKEHSGFTLIELAIVLVIIALLMGGVLTGQELIKQAQIRNVISTLHSYDIAVNAFRAKYNNALLSDFTRIEAFGINKDGSGANNFFVTDGGSSYNGNGDGYLESNGFTDGGHINMGFFNGEIANAFIALTNLNLVKGGFSNATASNQNNNDFQLASLLFPEAYAAPSATIVKAGVNYPKLPIGGGILLVTSNKKLEYIIGVNTKFSDDYFNLGVTSPGAEEVVALSNSLTPEEAYFIDSKTDDGKPNSGATQATVRFSAYNSGEIFSPHFIPADTGSEACALTTDPTSDYNIEKKTKLCTLHIRAST